MQNSTDILIAELVEITRNLNTNIQNGVLSSQLDKESVSQFMHVIEYLYFEINKKDKIIKTLLKPFVKV